MTKKIMTIGLNDSVRKAYQIMTERKIRHLPVVDKNGDVVGILSDRDLQRAMTPTKSENSFEVSVEFDPVFEVKDFMSWPVRTVLDDTSIRDVALQILNEKISAVIVIGYGHSYRGIITTDDLIKYLISLMSKDPGSLRLKISQFIDDGLDLEAV
jgi:acetoin utilization protein AcuB